MSAETTGGGSKKHTRSRGRAKKAAAEPVASGYGLIPLNMLRGPLWVDAHDIGESAVGKSVVVFGTVRAVRQLSKTLAVLVLLDWSSTVLCVIDAAADERVTTRMVRFAVTLPKESPIEVEGVVTLPSGGRPLTGTTQKVEIQVTKLHSIKPMVRPPRPVNAVEQ